MRLFETRTPGPIRSYLRAAFFLHGMTFAELVLLCIIFSQFSISPEDTLGGERFANLMLIAFFTALPIFSQLDARSRFQNYKQVKDQMFLYGFDRRILKPVLKSRCQRDAALAAAEELGYGKMCRIYFRNSGYRWYHLIPDFVFRAPHFLLTPTFWRKTFFMPTYRPKVDFNMTDQAPVAPATGEKRRSSRNGEKARCRSGCMRPDPYFS